MQDRRNYYRVLQVQPDAPVEVIKTNYRTLLQKMRLHPDLGGDNRRASQINQAYQVLKDPLQRALYDKQLLKDFHIQALSQGALAGDYAAYPRVTEPTYTDTPNRRNYYRILNIQTDAPAAIITASYRMLMRNPRIPVELIQEAYAVLSDSQRRNAYDARLKKGAHRTNSPPTESSGSKSQDTDVNRATAQYMPVPTTIPGRHSSAYQPLITQYCHFCKSPHAQCPSGNFDDLCVVCASPLFSAPKESISGKQRGLSRVSQQGHLNYYTEWPGGIRHGWIEDLSPDGLRFITAQRLERDQIIKVDNDYFQCVAKIMHRQSNPEGISIGSRFITVLFNTQRGNFISARA